MSFYYNDFPFISHVYGGIIFGGVAFLFWIVTEVGYFIDHYYFRKPEKPFQSVWLRAG